MIIFVRHGETELNANRALQGRTDRQLTERGFQQAQCIADALAGVGGVRVVASPLLRAQQTAGVIAEACGLALEVDERLIEIDYGQWDAMPIEEAMVLGGSAWFDDPAFAPPGGESLEMVAARAGEFVAAYAPSGDDDITIAVSHAGTIKGALTSSLGLSALHAWRMFMDVASISRLMWRNDVPVLRTFNETAHLSD